MGSPRARPRAGLVKDVVMHETGYAWIQPQLSRLDHLYPKHSATPSSEEERHHRLVMDYTPSTRMKGEGSPKRDEPRSALRLMAIDKPKSESRPATRGQSEDRRRSSEPLIAYATDEKRDTEMCALERSDANA